MVERSHVLTLVYQKSKREPVVRSKSCVFLSAAWIDTENNGVLFLGRRPAIAKLAELFGADRRFIGRVEYQHHVLSGQTAERDSIPVLIGKRKAGCGIANRKS